MIVSEAFEIPIVTDSDSIGHVGEVHFGCGTGVTNTHFWQRASSEGVISLLLVRYGGIKDTFVRNHDSL